MNTMKYAQPFSGGSKHRMGNNFITSENGSFPYQYIVDLPLKQIDFSDNLCSFTWGDYQTPLEDSIRGCGLINPPLLLEKEKNSLAVICGFQRIECCRNLGWGTIPALVMEKPLPPADRLLISFWDNVSHRELNIIEKSIVIKKLSFFLSPEKICSEFLPVLGLHPHKREIERALKLIELPTRAKQAVIDGLLAVDTALQLYNFDQQDRTGIVEFLMELRLGSSKQKEILEFMYEICRIENISPRELIKDDEISAIQKHEELSRPQKAGLIRLWFKKRRFPRLTAVEEDFQSWLKTLHLDNTVSIKHPPYFEGKKRKIEFSVVNHEQLGQTLHSVTKIYNDGLLIPFFKKTYGI